MDTIRKISKLANNLTTSPILTFAGEVNAKKTAGEEIYNLTIGDFDPNIYPIPKQLKQEIIHAYEHNLTNYPGAFGLNNLRHGIQKLIKYYCDVTLDVNNIQVASGSRPLIYSAFRTIIDKGDHVLFPTPSWNNDYYSLLSSGHAIEVETQAQNSFMPTKEELLPHIQQTTLIALCSPQNPTGTILSKQQLIDICDLVVNENKRRAGQQKPLYIIFDQVYWLLTFQQNSFYHAQNINPAIHDYAVFIDGMSKSFAGTGIRVGWATGPTHIIDKMRSLIAHIGAWAPTPEQYATGVFLQDIDRVGAYLESFKAKVQTVLNALYIGFEKMHKNGLPIKAIKPEASIYLSIQLDLVGKKTIDGRVLDNFDDVVQYLLDIGKVAILPFAWFGAKHCDQWFRISVGTCEIKDVDKILSHIKNALENF